MVREDDKGNNPTQPNGNVRKQIGRLLVKFVYMNI